MVYTATGLPGSEHRAGTMVGAAMCIYFPGRAAADQARDVAGWLGGCYSGKYNNRLGC